MQVSVQDARCDDLASGKATAVDIAFGWVSACDDPTGAAFLAGGGARKRRP